MATKDKENHTKKGVYALLIIIGIVFLFLYINKWQEVKELEKYLNSYLIETNTISLEMTDIDEINNVLSEAPSYYFVYISYTKDKDVHKLEEKLKPLIDEYHLQNYFYFINVTDIKDTNKDYLDDIASELNLSTDIKDIPTILYFKDGSFISSVDNAKDFEELLKKENISAM